MKRIFDLVRLGAGVLAFCLLFAFTTLWMRGARLPAVATVAAGDERPVFVLDAGHGGEDGGAVGANGVLEKDLNLAVTCMLGDMLQAAGQRVVYTRTEDRLLYTEEQNIRGQRKNYDLRNRLVIARGQKNAVFVSIHMNSFSDARYSGLQVYYGKGHAGSHLLAEGIQAAVRTDLQPDNSRTVKAAGSSIYLLAHADMPAVLIECGFLSNPTECQKLSEQDYQRQLSFSIFCAMMEYISQDGGQT